MAPTFLHRVQQRHIRAKEAYRKKGYEEVFRHPGPKWGLRRRHPYDRLMPADKYPWKELTSIPQGFFEQVYEDGRGEHWDFKKRVCVQASVPISYGSVLEKQDLLLEATVRELDKDGFLIPEAPPKEMLLLNERSRILGS